jgi:hypothetical protein
MSEPASSKTLNEPGTLAASFAPVGLDVIVREIATCFLYGYGTSGPLS